MGNMFGNAKEQIKSGFGASEKSLKSESDSVYAKTKGYLQGGGKKRKRGRKSKKRGKTHRRSNKHCRHTYKRGKRRQR